MYGDMISNILHALLCTNINENFEMCAIQWCMLHELNVCYLSGRVCVVSI